MRVDRIWMNNRNDQSKKRVTKEFISDVDEFLEFAICQDNFVSDGKIRCPCSRCYNRQFLDMDIVRTHLYKHGFIPNYYQ